VRNKKHRFVTLWHHSDPSASLVRMFKNSSDSSALSGVTIVDVEFLHETHSKKIIKELCIYHLDTNQLQNFIINPSLPWRYLDPKVNAINSYITDNIHKIHYNSGFIYPETAFQILRANCAGRKIFVKGFEKAQFIAGILQKVVYNLDNLNCPKIVDLPANSESGCLIHESEFAHCCQVKSVRFGVWLKSELNFLSTLQAAYHPNYSGNLVSVLNSAKVKPKYIWSWN
jgi:hypothetical protein